MAQENLDIVRRAYEAFGRGDTAALLALLDEKVQWTTRGPADLPIAGRRIGPEAVGEFFQRLTGLLDIQDFRPGEFIAQGETVVVMGEDTARVKATGRIIDTRWVHVFTIRDGKVASMEEYTDMSAVVAELRSVQAPL